MVTRWTNWGGSASCEPKTIARPSSEDEIAAIVKQAAASGDRVKVFGAGHSFTDIACTDGALLSLENHARVVSADASSGLVTVDAGITVERLSEELAARGLALPNLGDIGYQSIAGAISTATHGTGATKQSIHAQVRAVRMVTGDGSLLDANGSDPELLRAARASLGALGVITQVTLQCVPAFTLREVKEPAKVDDVLARLDDLVASNEHFEFYCFPHTDVAMTIANNLVDSPPRPPGRLKQWFEDVLFENRLFGLVCGLGKMRPAWIPGLARLSGRVISRAEKTDRSDKVFTSPRLVRFVEMEYAIPRAAARDALTEVRRMIDARGHRISFPIEMRFLAPDDALLGTAAGRETAYVACHVYRGMPFEPYFRDVEAIMNRYEGRPHWGKWHFQTAETLAPRYPDWERFRAIRDRLDPERRFGNAYLARVLGA